MFLTPLSQLTWAYQLHYHICFRTHRRVEFFNDYAKTDDLSTALTSIASANGYHLLETKLRARDVQLVLSLRPDHRISDVLKQLKGRSSALLCPQLGIAPPLWARGYLARSVGRVRVQAVRDYLARQAEHHGYSKRALPPVFRFRAAKPKVLTVAHASFELKHHLVLATQLRGGIFGSQHGEALINYWHKVAASREFALDQATVLPDHIHLLLRIAPTMSIEECALSLMNNGQYFVGKNYPLALVAAKLDQLWQPSAYAGSCGELTTALLKAFLRD